MTGFIYAIECGSRIKIGFSKKPDARFNKIASDAPFPCVMLGYWPGTIADELEVHAKFRAIRSHGEWFASTTEILAFIADMVVTPEVRTKRFVVKDTDSPLTVWRKTNGLRQQDVAAMIGRVTSFVSQLETGISSPSLEIALKIAEISKGAVPVESLTRKVGAAE